MNRDERRVRTALLTYAADRRRLELTLPAHMLWHCCCSIGGVPGSTDKERAWWNSVAPHLQVACLEPLVGLPEVRWAVATELSKLITKMTLGELSGRPVITCMMATLRWVEALLDHDVLEMIEGSAIDQAMDVVLDMLREHEALAGNVDRSARKAARTLHARMQSLGLYQGADIFTVAS